jgi:tetratricopeptide (TPR) repeat protein
MFLAAFRGREMDRIVLFQLLDFLQLILAMALAGVASAVPGFLEVFTRYAIPKKWTLAVRAGGALAVFVLILVLRPAEGLKKMIDYDRTLSQARSALHWNRSTPGHVPGPGAGALCQTLIELDAGRWEGFYCRARYHFFLRQYAEMSKTSADALRVYVGQGGPVTAVALQSMRVPDIDGIEILRNLALAETGLVRFNAGDPALARAAFAKAIEQASAIRLSTSDYTIDLIYDLEILELAVWLRGSPERALKTYSERRDAWDKFIDGGLAPYPVAWAHYHRAVIDIHLASLINTGAILSAHNHSASTLSQQAESDLIACVSDIRAYPDVFPIQKDWLRHYLLVQGDPKSPRSSDPILSQEIRDLILQRAPLKRRISELLV